MLHACVLTLPGFCNSTCSVVYQSTLTQRMQHSWLLCTWSQNLLGKWTKCKTMKWRFFIFRFLFNWPIFLEIIPGQAGPGSPKGLQLGEPLVIAELFSRAYGVSLADSSITVYSWPRDIFERSVSLTLRVWCLFIFCSASITVRHSIYIDMSTLLSVAVHVL